MTFPNTCVTADVRSCLLIPKLWSDWCATIKQSVKRPAFIQRLCVVFDGAPQLLVSLAFPVVVLFFNAILLLFVNKAYCFHENIDGQNMQVSEEKSMYCRSLCFLLLQQYSGPTSSSLVTHSVKSAKTHLLGVANASALYLLYNFVRDRLYRPFLLV